MTVTPSYASTMLGQWVESHSAYGVHQGILREVRPDGILLEMPRRPGVGMVDGSAELEAAYADKPTVENYENVQFFNPFFNPFFFGLISFRHFLSAVLPVHTKIFAPQK